MVVVVVVVAALGGAGGLAPVAPSHAQVPTAPDVCLPSAGTGRLDNTTLTNRLIAPPTIPDPVRLGWGDDPERYSIDLETRLRQDPATLREAPNFDVIARLTTASGESVEDEAFVVTAAATNQRNIELRVCLDPGPTSGTLGAGTYRADVEFIDPRIPETTLAFEVWIGGAAGMGYATVVVVVGVILLAALPVGIAVGALVARRDWRAELRGTLVWLLPLLGIAAVVYAITAGTFLATDRYHLWSASFDGAAEFLGYVLSRLTIVLTAATALLAIVPKWRETWGKVFARQPAETAATPLPAMVAPEAVAGVAAAPAAPSIPAAVPERELGPAPTDVPAPPAPAQPSAPRPMQVPGPGRVAAQSAQPTAAEAPPLVRVPRDSARRRRWPAPRWAVAATTVGVVVTLVGALVLDPDWSEPPGGPVTTGGADVEEEPTTTTGPSGDDGLFAPAEVLGGLRVGRTPGDEAVADLRSAGFVVFDYLVCSNSVPEPDLLREVSETETQEVLVGRDGPTGAAGRILPPASLDVLITSGDPCG